MYGSALPRKNAVPDLWAAGLDFTGFALDNQMPLSHLLAYRFWKR
jgi:hypothetical protein